MYVKVNEEYLVTYNFNGGQMRLIIVTNHGTHHHSVPLFTIITGIESGEALHCLYLQRETVQVAALLLLDRILQVH